MGRVHERLRELRERGGKALIPFVTAGFPDLATTEELVVALEESGADVIELGVPFSDPIAEGPTIQRSSECALQRGTSLRRVLELVKRLRTRTDVPLVLMGYANPFYAMGEEVFVASAADAGVDGLIVPDLPPEEGAELFATAKRRGIDPILMAAPTTVSTRLAMLAERTRGFLYYVSVTGVTGAREKLAEGLVEGVARVRDLSDVSVCVGFGISAPEQAREVAGFADGIVVGSALVDRIEGARSPEAAVEAAARFVAGLRSSLPG